MSILKDLPANFAAQGIEFHENPLFIGHGLRQWESPACMFPVYADRLGPCMPPLDSKFGPASTWRFATLESAADHALAYHNAAMARAARYQPLDLPGLTIKTY